MNNQCKKILQVIGIIAVNLVIFSLFNCGKKDEHTQMREKRESLRAYEGAPPVIPHSINRTTSDYCLVCHEKGVIFEAEAVVMNQKNAQAKITPHPQWVNCIQCHGLRIDDSKFRKNKFMPYRITSTPFTKTKDNEGTPPAMPHMLQNHDNCIVCHLSKTAYATIIPEHGETEGCPLCHQQNEKLITFPEEGD